MSKTMADNKFIDYDGPTGLYVATKEGIKALGDPTALVAMADSAMLSSLGYTETADEYQTLVATRRAPALT